MGIIVIFLITMMTQVSHINNFWIEIAAKPISLLFYFSLGIFFAKNKEIFRGCLKNWKLFAFIGSLTMGVFIFYFHFNDYVRFADSFYAVGFLFLFLANFSRPNKFLSFFDRNSLLIYLIHPFFQSILLESLFGSLAYDSFAGRIIFFSLTLAMSVLAVMVLNKTIAVTQLAMNSFSLKNEG